MRHFRQRARRAFLIIVGASVGAIVALVAMNAVDSDRPAPLWTEADLGELPPEQDNGWHIVFDDAVSRSYTENQNITPKGAEAAKGVLTGERSLASATPLLHFSDRERAFASTCRRGYAKPRFADGTRLGGDGKALAVYRCNLALIQEALLMLAQGDPERAERLTLQILRAQHDYLTSARSVVAHSVGLSGSVQAMRLAIVLVSERGTSTPALQDAIRRFEPELPHDHRGRIAEYVWALEIVGQAERGELGRAWQWTLDPGETIAMLNEHAQATEPLPNPTDDPGWWVDNMAGDDIAEIFSPIVHRVLNRDNGYAEARRAAAIVTAYRPFDTRSHSRASGRN